MTRGPLQFFCIMSGEGAVGLSGATTTAGWGCGSLGPGCRELRQVSASQGLLFPHEKGDGPAPHLLPCALSPWAAFTHTPARWPPHPLHFWVGEARGTWRRECVPTTPEVAFLTTPRVRDKIARATALSEVPELDPSPHT